MYTTRRKWVPSRKTVTGLYYQIDRLRMNGRFYVAQSRYFKSD